MHTPFPMRHTLTPGQAVYLHGWLSPKLTLTWNDIHCNDSINMTRLTQANIPLHVLHDLQPDTAAWIRAKKVDLTHCASMQAVWPADAIRDFHADLGDLITMRWPPDVMVQVGATYHALLDIGLTPAVMFLFQHLTLLGWIQLGMTRKDVEAIPEPDLMRLFSMSKADVIRATKPTPSAATKQAP